MCFRPPDVTSGPLVCPECNKKIVSPNFRPVVCPFCKSKLPAAPDLSAPGVVECPNCGAKNPTVAKSCSNCGATEDDFKTAAQLASGIPSAPKMPGAPKKPGTIRPSSLT